jgi:hypothetical protein
MIKTGITKVNNIVMDSVKHWLLKVCRDAQKKCQDGTEELARVLSVRGALHKSLVSQMKPLFDITRN